MPKKRSYSDDAIHPYTQKPRYPTAIREKEERKGLRSKTITSDDIKFIKEYKSNGGNVSRAGRAVFTNLKDSSAKMKGHSILRKPGVRALIMAIDDYLIEEAPKSIAKLTQLRDRSKQEPIQLAASKSLLENYNTAVKKHDEPQQPTNILITGMSNDELISRINKLRTRTPAPLPGTDASEDQGGPLPHDGGDPGVQSPGPGSP